MPQVLRLRNVALLSALLLAACPWPGRAAEFNRTLPVAPGMRLDVRVFGGEVVVRAWERNEVRVRASHFSSDEIELQADGRAVQVRARTRAGAPHGIDLDIDVPSWMAIGVAGPYVDVVVNGIRADVTVETVRGDIRVQGGDGTIALSTIEGQVVLENARGHARLRAANDGIRVTGFEGALNAETVNGSVRLRQVAAPDVDVSTMGGDILWEGPLSVDGRYQLVTHSGDIDVTVSSSTSATIIVHAPDGHVHSQFPQPLRADPDHRATLVLGSGRSQLGLESFNGIISLRPSER
jgi:DUF4097 and DUF4098 domain-containing protein YvlB